MKYCANCGRELVDEAVICMGCGCSAEAPAPKKEEKAPVESTERKNLLLVALHFAFTLSVAICLFFLILSAALPYGYLSEWSSDVYIYPNGGLAVMSWLFSLSSMGFGVAGLIAVLVKRLGTEKVLPEIARFIIGGILILLTFIILMASV